jgi:hypothetical protein
MQVTTRYEYMYLHHVPAPFGHHHVMYLYVHLFTLNVQICYLPDDGLDGPRHDATVQLYTLL